MLEDDLFDPVAAGAYLGGTRPIAKQTLAKYRCHGRGPTFHKLPNGLIRYRKADLDAWLAKSLRFGSTSEEG
jgi:hypothetical protein